MSGYLVMEARMMLLETTRIWTLNKADRSHALHNEEVRATASDLYEFA